MIFHGPYGSPLNFLPRPNPLASLPARPNPLASLPARPPEPVGVSPRPPEPVGVSPRPPEARAFLFRFLPAPDRPYFVRYPSPPDPPNFKNFYPRPARTTWPRGPRGTKPVDRPSLIPIVRDLCPQNIVVLSAPWPYYPLMCAIHY